MQRYATVLQPLTDRLIALQGRCLIVPRGKYCLDWQMLQPGCKSILWHAVVPQ